MSKKFKSKKPDPFNIQKGKMNKTLLYIFGGLVLFGTIMIFDASVYKANAVFQDSFYFLKQHIAWVVMGVAGAVGAYFVNLKALSKISFFLLIVSVIALVVVLVAGVEINGAKRWFEIFGITIQPAEFAKLTLIIYLSSILSREERKGSDFESQKKLFISQLITFGVVIVTVLLLIILEPDMGTAIVIALTSFFIFLLAGENKIHTFGSFLVAAIMGVLGTIAAIIEPYRLQRIQTFLHLLLKGEVDNPTGEGYQIQQILIGIGSSGLFGKGFGQSRQRFGYLVENTAFTDSTFAVVLEELGFAIALILVFLWGIILWQGLMMAQKIEFKFGKLLASGITIWLCSQAFLNMGANVALIPLTGIPLPFFTYGGSSTIVTLVGVGLLLNVSRYAKEHK